MIEETILSNLVMNDTFARKVFPYIKGEYFDDLAQKKLFDAYSTFMDQYKEPPTKEALAITVGDMKDINENTFKDIKKLISDLKIDKDTNQEWLVTETEKFCQERDLYNSIKKAILIIQGEDKVNDKGAIPKMLSDSLGVCFDSNLGHDYIDDYMDRYEFYHRREERIEFDIDLFNKITKGGLPNKSLTVWLAESGGGKTIVMCHCAAANYMHGKNVLYITAEMAEERIAERIDANLLNITMDELKELPRETFKSRIEKVKSKTPGKLKIKEYPTGSAHAGHFRHYINELRMKEGFVPDIIYIDYLNICASSRIKGANAANSYTLVKNIAEEIRGLAMELNLPIVSCSQFNRGAYSSSDVDMTSVSESMGLVYTVDAMFAIINSEELSQMKQVMIKQLKNRWGDANYYRRFIVGMDRSRMKLFNVSDSAQSEVVNEPIQSEPQIGLTKRSKSNLFNAEGIK